MNVPRFNAAAAVLNGYIHVAGGDGTGWDHLDLDSVELYDSKCDEWINIKPMERCRSGFALIESNGFLYAMGGDCDMIEKYDPRKNYWMEVKK